MLNLQKKPFNTDHGKCLNCQFRDGELRPDGTRTHLCSSCQWDCWTFCQDEKRTQFIESELRSIANDLDPYVKNTVYFDEQRPSDVIEQIESIIEDGTYDDDGSVQELNELLASLKQIHDDLGFNRLVRLQ